MEAKNIEELKSLISKYELIDNDVIEIAKNELLAEGKIANAFSIKKHLTGFGSKVTGSLCNKVENKANTYFHVKCEECVFGADWACMKGENAETYFGIENAVSTEDMVKAYKARAAFLKEKFSTLIT